jgi:hypothetical protein
MLVASAARLGSYFALSPYTRGVGWCLSLTLIPFGIEWNRPDSRGILVV